MTTAWSRQVAVMVLLLAAFAGTAVVQATSAMPDSPSPVQFARPPGYQPAPYTGSAARA